MSKLSKNGAIWLIIASMALASIFLRRFLHEYIILALAVVLAMAVALFWPEDK